MMATTVTWSNLGADALLPGPHLVAIKLGPSVAMSDIAGIASGLYVPDYVSHDSVGAVPYLRVDNVREFVPNMSSGDVVFVNADTVPSYDRVSVRAGDVILPRTATLGRALVVPDWMDGAVMSQHITRLRLHAAAVIDSPLLLAAYLNSAVGQEAVLARASGTTRLELTHASLSEVPIPMSLASCEVDASLLERIGCLMKSMQTSVHAAQAACDALLLSAGIDVPSIRQGFRIFSCELMPDRFVSSALPRFHEPEMEIAMAELTRTFEVARLGDIATVRRGKGTSSKEYAKSGLPYLRTSSLINGGIDLFPDHFGTESTFRRHGQYVGAGDILLSIEGRVGLVALLAEDERVLIKNHIEFVRLDDSTTTPPEFVAAWLGAGFAQAQIHQATVIQTTIPGMASASRDLLIPLAPKDPSLRESFIAKRDEIVSWMRRSVEGRSQLRVLLESLMASVEHAIKIR